MNGVDAGHTFWSGRPKERRDAGVTFALRIDAVGRLPCLLQGINDHLLRRGQGPRALLAYIPEEDKLIAHGDFSARVGTDFAAWRKVQGTQGITGYNGKGVRFPHAYASHHHLPMRKKATWMHPQSRR
nr:unnamed protein product [Spirometra erinaceieuropaei]